MKLPGVNAKTQEKVNKALAAARKHGANIVRGAKGSAYSLVTGAVLWDVGKTINEKSKTAQENAYTIPIVYAIGGHMLKKKQYDAGAAMLGVAGFIGRQAYAAEEQKKADKAKAGGLTGAMNTPPAGPTKGVSGGEAGAVVGRWQNALALPQGARGVSGGEAGALVGGAPHRIPAPRNVPPQAAAVVRDELMGLGY